MIETTPTNTQPAGKPNGKSRRGFASMDRERHKLVSSRGGKSPRQPRLETSRDGRSFLAPAATSSENVTVNARKQA